MKASLNLQCVKTIQVLQDTVNTFHIWHLDLSVDYSGSTKTCLQSFGH